jgi:Zn finger protein HypA/HybF involved in hydrogenase expression
MPRSSATFVFADDSLSAGLQSAFEMRSPELICTRCDDTLECVEQSRRSGTWLGSLICPKCRSEYFYAYRWGRLMRRS